MSRSKSAKRQSNSPTDPRKEVFEAKFKKYLANKRAKESFEIRKQMDQKEDFDIWTKSITSPSKHSRRFKPSIDPLHQQFSGKYAQEDLFPRERDELLLMHETLV